MRRFLAIIELIAGYFFAEFERILHRFTSFSNTENPAVRIAMKFGVRLASSRKVQPKRSGVSVERLRPLQYPEHDHEADYCLC